MRIGSKPSSTLPSDDWPVFIFDLRGIVCSANGAFLNLFSAKRPCVMGHPVSELISSMSIEQLRGWLEEAPRASLENEFPVTVSQKPMDPSDPLPPMEWRIFPLLSASGSVEKFCAVGRDVSSGVGPFIPAHLDDTFFKEALENIEDVFWIAVSGRILYISPGFEKIWGISPESLYEDQRSFMRSIHPDDRNRVREAFEAELQTGNFDQEYRIIRPDGSLRWIRARVFPAFRDGFAIRTVGIAQDVTAYKSLEESLSHENAFGKAVINHAADGICVYQQIPEPPYLRFTVWNRRMLEITGYRMSEINRRGWFQTVYPNPSVRALAMRSMEKVREGGSLVDEEWTIARSDGTERTVSVSISTFSVRDGSPLLLAVMRDVTQKTQAEEKLRHALNELKEKHREVNEANVALTVLLRKRDEEREEMRQSILANLRHMVLPYIEKMRGEPASEGLCRHYCDVIERNLNEMASSFIWELSNRYLNLTPAEIRTAELLKKGKTTKEIAREMGVAPSTINTHREGLRKKLGITGKKTNLTTFLRMLK